MRHDFHCDIAVCAAAVIGNELHPRARGHEVRERARDDIAAAARPVGQDDADRLLRIGAGDCGNGQRHQNGKEDTHC